jgi:hypothetical protein
VAEPTIRERLDVLIAMEGCLQATAALRIALRALAWYADERNWKEDDWGVPSVVQHPDYGKPGQKARNAIKRIGRELAE